MELKRSVAASLLAAISDPAGFYPCVLIQSTWPDGTVYVHSGSGSISWNSLTWTGIERIAEVQVGPESEGGIVPEEAVLTLKGTLEAVLDYMDPRARGGLVKMWLATTTEPGGTTLDGTPLLIFTGYIDNNEMPYNPATGAASLQVGVGTGPAARENAAIYHSPEDQRARYPTDTLLERTAVAAAWRQTPIQF